MPESRDDKTRSLSSGWVVWIDQIFLEIGD
jgi:hypothetical protein